MTALCPAKQQLMVSFTSCITCYFGLTFIYDRKCLVWRQCFLFVDIESKLRRIEEDPEGSGTSHLFNCIEGVSSIANRAFGPLFERQVCRLNSLYFINTCNKIWVCKSGSLLLLNMDGTLWFCFCRNFCECKYYCVGSSWEDKICSRNAAEVPNTI